jgi:probable selenium-dependent hydroxylase accessory protein YqeC
VSLCDALRIHPNDIVSFVGAGGKTTATMHIAAELAGRGYSALVTTTTKTYEPVASPDEQLLLADSLDAALDQLAGVFDQAPIAILARKRLDEGELNLNWLDRSYPIALRPHKLQGIPPEWVAPIAESGVAQVILIEADGAAHRMLKAPNHHEPVIPESTTLVAPMADVHVLGKSLTEESVHRPTLLADLAGIPLGHPISSEVFAIALGHENGGMKGIAPHARVIPLLTTHEAGYRCKATERAIRLLLLSPRVDHIVMAHLRSRPIRWEIFTR